MRNRDRMREQAVRSSQVEDWILYRQLRNSCTAKMVEGVCSSHNFYCEPVNCARKIPKQM